MISHSVQPDRAFHSTVSTKFVSTAWNCSFFTLYTFPQNIIIDSYELADHRLAFEFWGESNLELPVFALNQSATSRLLVNWTPAGEHPEEVVADVPIHARYGKPGLNPLTIAISAPAYFWACPSCQSVSSAFSSEPPVVNSTMLSLFACFSVPVTPSHFALLQVPVGSKRDLLVVELGTPIVILVVFLWLAYRSWRVAIALESHHLKEQ